MNSTEKISIRYNCHQPFWNLPKKDGETWCKSCKKQIPDLRHLSLEEIHAYKQKEGAEACGILSEEHFVITEKTQNGPGMLRIVMAGTLAAFVGTTKLHSQTTAADSVQIVQLDTATASNEKVIAQTDAKKDCSGTVIPDEPEKVKRPLRYRRLNLFTIGHRKWYLSWSFPFLHIHYIGWRGKF